MAFRSKADTLLEWTPTIDYLSKVEPEHTFTIEALTYPEMNDAVKNGTIDFVITNSGHYVYLEKEYHISRIATMMHYKAGCWIDRFGGVIFTKAKRDDIESLDDIREKKIAAVDAESLGGYAAQMYELSHKAIDATSLRLRFTGMPHSKVVEEVLFGRTDVGFVRTDVLEDMVHSGKINLQDIKIIHQQKKKDFPYLLSTELYPEWPIAQMAHTSKDTSNEVVIALLSALPHSTVEEGDISWRAPMEYRDIHEMFQALRLPPYDKVENFTFIDVYHRYSAWIWIIIVLSFVILAGVIIEIALRRKLSIESQKNEAFLRLSGDGIHILDANGCIVQVSDIFCRMLGYTREEMIGKNVSEWDVHIVQEETSHQLKTQEYDNHVLQTKHKRRDGTLYDTQIIVNNIEIAKERWVYCSARDITEELYEQAQSALSALVYNYSSDAILIADMDGKIVSINPAFETLTGYVIADVFGMSTNILHSGEQSQEFYQEMWAAINTGGYWEGEISDRARNGDMFSKWLTIRTVYDKNNQPYRRIAIFSEISDHKEEKYKIWYQANFDMLTGLCNRSMFVFRLEQRLLDVERTGQMVALFFLDLDHFKEVNDTLGHDKGDILLKEAAKRISRSVRKNDIVARLGGDEFTILLTKVDSTEDIQSIAQKILLELSSVFVIHTDSVFISASIGITASPEDGITSETLLKNADQAMYAAKSKGRNQYHFFTVSMQDSLQKRMLLIQDLRRAIEEEQFVVYYQPIVDAVSKKIYKAEALVRWIKPNGNIVSPADFIPIAEETGLITEIGNFVFRETSKLLSRWRSEFEPNFQISVNKSPVQFRREFIKGYDIIDLIQKYSLP
ncbi:MAG: diguanylate cyclase, partial [Sulfurimonas sp.]